MSESLWISKTGLDAQQTRMSTISNNLANVGTTGFKRSRAIFEDLLYQNVRQVGSQTSQDTLLPSRPADRYRSEGGGNREAVYPGQSQQDR